MKSLVAIFGWDKSNPLKALLDYARGNGLLHGIFAIIYGTLTFIYGDDLWEGPAYYNASKIPYAPQSWGAVAMLAGIIIILGSVKGKEKLVKWGCFFMSTWCLFFASLFLKDFIETKMAFILPAAVSYYHAAFLMVNRYVLAGRIT